MQKSCGGAIVSLSSTGNLVYIENYAGHGTNKVAWLKAMVRYLCKMNLVNLILE